MYNLKLKIKRQYLNIYKIPSKTKYL